MANADCTRKSILLNQSFMKFIQCRLHISTESLDRLEALIRPYYIIPNVNSCLKLIDIGTEHSHSSNITKHTKSRRTT